jgi:hypothetical protein
MVRLPTRLADWRLLGRTVRLVLGIPGYALLAVGFALTALSVFSFVQNLTLVAFVVTGSLAPGAKLRALSELFPFLGTNYGLLDGVGIVLVAMLTGINLAMVTYHLREHGLTRGGSSGSAVGVVLGLLGAGCAACGSAILVGLLSLVGAAGLVTLLPFEGKSITYLAAVVLVLSLYWLADGMRGGMIQGCPVDLGA